jgi:hypothetical protein
MPFVVVVVVVRPSTTEITERVFSIESGGV